MKVLTKNEIQDVSGGGFFEDVGHAIGYGVGYAAGKVADAYDAAVNLTTDGMCAASGKC